ncbi:hypothetical protein Nmel_008003, partial [Mimus melanotis]
MTWCPWQSKVRATGGGMKYGILCVWHMNCEKIIQKVIKEEIVLKPDTFRHLSLLATIVLAKTPNTEREEGEEKFPEHW